LKKNVFSDCLNVDSVQLESLSWSGSKFQTAGLATENARPPSVLHRWRGTVRKQQRVERSRWWLAMSVYRLTSYVREMSTVPALV